MIDLSPASALRHEVGALIYEISQTTILPRFKALADGEIKTKSGPNDLVTIADEEAEEKLTDRLSQLLPGSVVIGEEATAADDSILNRFAGDDPVWVIDPIDGTANFVAGRESFGVIVALVSRGETTMGWIHNPLTKQTLWAGEGHGAWIGARQLELNPDGPSDLSEMSATIYHQAFRTAAEEFAQVNRLGSAAMEYWSLTDETTHVCNFSNLKPWDHAAGVLIHAEAGGYSAFLDGDAYKPGIRNKRGILSAPSEAVWQQVRSLADETKI